MSRKSILVIAGEISGDQHAARLIRALLDKDPDIDVFGIGGDMLAATGMEIIYHSRDMAVLGLAEVLARYSFFRRVFKDMIRIAEERRPDMILLVDYPGFNLRFAERVHAMGLKVVYFICPQVWAWNRGRVPRMAKIVDRLLAIFPFEPDVFEGTGLQADFVGHPLVGEARRELASPPCAVDLNGEPAIAILPGSRSHEIKRILPTMWRAAGILQGKYPEACFVIAAASEEIEACIRAVIEKTDGGPAKWSLETGKTRDVLRQCRAAFVTSGTATLETTFMKCPMVIVYKVNWLTYLAGRMVIRVSHLGIINVIAGRTVCPEYIQHHATPDALARGIEPLLRDGPERGAMLRDYEAVIGTLGETAPEERGVEILLEELASV